MVALLASLALPAGAGARGGDLDPSFGDRGRVVEAIAFDASWDQAQLEAGAAFGNTAYVLAGQTIHAFGLDGTKEAVFGGGAVRVGNPNGYLSDVSSLAVDSQGKVLVAGFAAPSLPPYGGDNRHDVPEYAMVARYLPNGALDPTFGEGGVVLTDFGLPHQLLGPNGLVADVPQVRAVGVAVDSVNRVILTGTRTAHSEGCNKAGQIVTEREAFVARLTAEGAPDESSWNVVSGFGTRGVTKLPGLGAVGKPVTGEGFVYFTSGAGPRCAEGDPVSGGVVLPGEPAELLTRLDRQGKPDPSFGANGWIRLRNQASRFAPRVWLDGSGRALLLGWRPANPEVERGPAQVEENFVKRLDIYGRPDPRFGKRGIAAVRLAGGSDAELRAIAPGPSGTIFLTGTWWPSPGQEAGPRAEQRRLFAGRLNGTGRLDRRFGHGGWVATRFGAGSQAIGLDVVVQAGRPLVLGAMTSPRVAAGLALARYRSGGTRPAATLRRQLAR